MRTNTTSFALALLLAASAACVPATSSLPSARVNLENPLPSPPVCGGPDCLQVGSALADWSDASAAFVTFETNAAEGWARQRLSRESAIRWQDDLTTVAGLNVLAFSTDHAGGFIRWNHVENPRVILILHRGSAGHYFGDGRGEDGRDESEWDEFLARHPGVMLVGIRWRDAARIPGPNSGRFTRRDNEPTNLAEMAHRRPVRVFRWIVENLAQPDTKIALLGLSAGSDAILSALDAQEPWLGRVHYFAPLSPGQNYDLVSSCNRTTPPGTFIDPQTGARGDNGASANIRITYAHLPDYLQLQPPTCAAQRMTEALAGPHNFRERLPRTGALHPDAVVRFAVGDRDDVDTNDGFTWTSGQLYHHPYFANYRREWYWTAEVPHAGLWDTGTQTLREHLASIEAALFRN